LKVKWILAHGDCDGICSAALAFAAFPEAQVFFTHPAGLLSDLNVVDGDVVILDVAATTKHFLQLVEKLAELSEKHTVIYVDHHPLRGMEKHLREAVTELVYEEGRSASDLAFHFFRDYLSEEMSRVAVYGAIADYFDDVPSIRRLLRMWDKRELYFETGILVQGVERARRRYNFKRRVAEHLSENKLPSELPELVERAVQEAAVDEEMRKEVLRRAARYGEVAYVLNVPWSTGKAAIYARAKYDVSVGAAGEERGKFIDLSLRTLREDLDLGAIVAEIAGSLGGVGGGHKKAAGARIPIGSFPSFVRELDRVVCLSR